MLVRAVNLIESAVDAVSSKHGETVALIARCLQEMTYTVKLFGQDLGGAVEFALYTAGTHKRALVRYHQATADVTTKAQLQRTMDRLTNVLGSDKPEWEKRVEQRAIKADMKDDYDLHYPILCEQAHTDNRALMYYMIETSTGLEVHQRLWPSFAAVYLGLAMGYFLMIMEMLLSIFNLPNKDPFAAAVKDWQKFEKTISATGLLRTPVSIDWDA